MVDTVTALPGDSDGIYIKGGTVNATGGNSAAGIGEGSLIDVMREGDAEMVISISGGTVKAYSNNLSDEAIQPEQSPKRNKQDIGGVSCKISITGGNVWAKGGGISSEKQVTFGWTSVNDSIYTYELNAEGDLLLAKDFKCKETNNLYPKGTTGLLKKLLFLRLSTQVRRFRILMRTGKHSMPTILYW